MTAYRFLHCSSARFLRNIDICGKFYFFEVNFNKYTIQWPIGHSGDDAVHKKKT